MNDQSPSPDAATPPRTPRWVKVFAVIAAAVVLLLLILLLTGNRHGPGRHMGGKESPPGLEHRVPHP